MPSEFLIDKLLCPCYNLVARIILTGLLRFFAPLPSLEWKVGEVKIFVLFFHCYFEETSPVLIHTRCSINSSVSDNHFRRIRRDLRKPFDSKVRKKFSPFRKAS